MPLTIICPDLSQGHDGTRMASLVPMISRNDITVVLLEEHSESPQLHLTSSSVLHTLHNCVYNI